MNSRENEDGKGAYPHFIKWYPNQEPFLLALKLTAWCLVCGGSYSTKETEARRNSTTSHFGMHEKGVFDSVMAFNVIRVR